MPQRDHTQGASDAAAETAREAPRKWKVPLCDFLVSLHFFARPDQRAPIVSTEMAAARSDTNGVFSVTSGTYAALRSTFLVSASGAVGYASAVVTGKVRATFLGVSGFGVSAIQQTSVAVIGILFGAGISISVVKLVDAARSAGDHARSAALWRAAWWLGCSVAAGEFLAVVLLSGWPWMRTALGVQSRADVVCIAGALALGLLGSIQCSRLSLSHDSRAMALAGVLAALGGAFANIILIWRFRLAGIAPGLLLAGLAMLAAYTFVLVRHVERRPRSGSSINVLLAARDLLRSGICYVGSSLAGSGALQSLPWIALALMGTTGAALFRAGFRLASMYVGILAVAMAQDYYPRLCLASSDTVRFRRLINEQHRATLLLTVPLVLSGIVVLPHTFGFFYTPAFHGAAAMLEWQLAGDILRFSDWSMSYGVLAACSGQTFMLMEVAAGASLLLLTWAGIRTLGLVGAGVAYLVQYVLYGIMLRILLKRRIGFAMSATNNLLLAAAMALAIVVVSPGLRWALPAGARIAIAFATGLPALVTLGGPLARRRLSNAR